MQAEFTQISPIEAYERYIVRNLFLPWTQDLIARAQPLTGTRVLDLACGTGIVSRTLAVQEQREMNLVGLDISPSMLAKAEALADEMDIRVQWHEACATCMPFPDGFFDAVLCQQGLQFFPNPCTALREVRRILKPGGLAVFSVWGPLADNPFYGTIDALVSRHLAAGALALPFSLSDLDVLRQLAVSAGLRLVTADQPHLRIHATDPEVFAAMCIRGATAVLPEFAALTRASQHDVLDRMHADLDASVHPFRQEDKMVFDTSANVLAVAH
jgi:ubiquinone/menaquinone biosynthesis C-methylase UbiE